MSRVVYAIGDVHGCAALLAELHAHILEDAAGREGEKLVVYLGDYIDRGPDSKGVVELVRKGCGLPSIALKGNHEDFAVNGPVEGWLRNGGIRTLASFGGGIPDDVVAWMRGLPLCHREGRWFFVHAGIDPSIGLAEQRPEVMLWTKKYQMYEGENPEGVTVVYGHTPGSDVEIEYGRICVDTGAVFGGALSCVVLTDRVERIIQAKRRLAA